MRMSDPVHDSATQRLLVVDDDRLVLASFAEGLADAGFGVLRATTGQEAVDICSRQRPSLVVIDVQLPGRSGIDAATEIRRNAMQADRKIGIATGVIMERDRLTANGAFDTLRGRARSEQRKVREVATEIVAAAEVLNVRYRPAPKEATTDPG